MINRRLLGFGLLMCCLFFASPVIAQDRHPLMVRIEEGFKKAEPEWKAQRATQPEALHLKSGKSDALIYVFVLPTADAAKDVYDGNNIALGRASGMRASKQKLSDFASEYMMWTSSYWQQINFREGNVCIQVITPSRVTTTRFARAVLTQVRDFVATPTMEKPD